MKIQNIFYFMKYFIVSNKSLDILYIGFDNEENEEKKVKEYDYKEDKENKEELFFYGDIA